MSLKLLLMTAVLGGTAIVAGAGFLMLPGSDLHAQSTAAHDGVLSPEEEDLVPHVSPEEAEAIAADFFTRLAPTDAELAALVPFPGAGNVPILRCVNHWPPSATEELILGQASPDRRMKIEIYEQLNVRRPLDTENCTCAGKVSPYEPVALILDEIKKEHGEPDGSLFYTFRDETRRVRRAVERLCKGEF